MSDFNPVNTADDRLRVLAGRVAALPPAQRELLRAQLEARGIAWTDVAAMPPSAPGESTASTGELPLSAAQRHLWVVHQLQPDTSAYHIALTWTLTGPLEVPALQQALQQVVERHDALRTVFLARDGKPYQRVLPHVACLLGVSDLRAPALAGIEAERIRQNALQPFDLTQAPLVRAQLLRTAEERHVLVLVLHHLVADGWSRGVLLRELAAGYRAAREDRATTAIPLTYQYSDYVRDQQAWLESAECRRQTAYWKTQLAALTPLDLPSDRPRGRAMEQPARTATRTLPSTLRPLLRAAGVQCGATPFMLLLTAFDVLLHRYTGRSDIAVGIPVAGRTGPQTADLIGFFVNTLVIRARADAAATFTDWLDIVKRAVADAFDHGDLPLANVVDAVVTTRDPGRNPLFDVMFQYQSDGYRMQNAAAPGLAFPGLHMSQDGIELAHTKFDMSWHVLDREDGLLLAVEYRTDLFDDARIERMLDHFTVLVEAALREPARHVGALPLLTEAERTRIAAWQRGPAPVGSGTPAARWAGLVERFERQVDRTPDARAAASPDGALSYRDLDAAANRVARHLIDRGVGAESRVGVCLPRTPQLLAMLLGVLKAGAAYVPLDPALPERRLRFMIDDAQLAVLIAGETEVARLYPVDAGTDGGPALLVPDRDRPVLDACADTRIARSVWPEQLAYVLYTSGSTGTPKGTQLTHGGLMHYLDWCLARYPVAAGQGAPVHSSIGFDATITGLFAPLLAGRAVMLLPDDASLVGLASALRADHGFVKLTPAHLAALPPLLEAQPLPADARLPRAFVIGGEALNESHVSFWRDRYPAIALLNEYGPTETVVGCCVHEVEPGDRGSIPIGRPIAGAALYLLDGHLQPVPVGVTGEICIGGAGVARGYLHRPDLTAERFVPDPFGARGCVMYRTGDLARYRSDGVVEYLGRADQQVQLRGYRIEIGEVEAALSRQPEIAETVVVLHVVGAAPALVAYLRVVDGTTVDVPALRQRLAQWLPPYMVPGHFVVLDAFALTANGKVDRRGVARAGAAGPATPGCGG
ncbi:MAG: amino acid adenylation domain-containing protein [Burkholderiales bacterium]|nr:amino acid adenylation domain-containing protein [Burkholderiales bacterium]